MADNKFIAANEKIAETVTGAYKKVEESVVSGYKAVENAAVGGYTKVEDAFVGKLFTKPGETVEEAKKRLRGE